MCSCNDAYFPRLNYIVKDTIVVSSTAVETDEAIIAEAKKSSVLQKMLQEGSRVNKTIVIPIRKDQPSLIKVNFVTKTNN